MKVLILAAGRGNLDLSEGGYPLSLTEFDGQPLIERLIESSRALTDAEVIVTLRGDEISAFHLDDVVRLVDSNVRIVRVDNDTKGALCTALLAIDAIDNDDELLILNGNELIDADFEAVLQDFRANRYAAGTIVFPSIHPRYSYVRLDSDGLVVEAAEKRPISRNATVGFYWFEHGRQFVEAGKSLIRKDDSIKGTFFICPAFNELVLLGLRVGVARLNSAAFHPLKSEKQIVTYENSVGEAAR